MIILLLEDNKEQAVALKEIIESYKIDWCVITAYTYESALSISKNTAIDLFLLDIELGNNSNKTGLDFASNVRSNNQYTNSPIIFITAIKEQIYSAINSIHCYGFIIKPYTVSSIHKAIDDLINMSESNIDYIQIKDTSGIYHNLYFKDIIYIEVAGHTTVFHTVNGNFTFNRHPLSQTLNELDSRFIRIHKKYIINCDYIKNYDKTTQKINTLTESLSVGRQYKSEFEKIYNI